MAVTLRDIRVWDTGEHIDLVVPTTGSPVFGRGVDAPDVDASRLTVAPGFADPHVHFRDPGQTAKETMITGCRAAAAGGYTSVLIMPNTVPAIDGEPVLPDELGAAEVLESGCRTVIDYLQHYEAIHDVTLPVRYDLCVAATKGRAGAVASDPERWGWYVRGVDEEHKDAAQLAHPVTAVSDDGSAVPSGAVLREVLDNCRKTGLYLIEHCEHHETGAVNAGPVADRLGVPGIPEETELAVVARDIELVRETGVHVHFQHVSTAIAFDAIRAAKAEGLPVTCETAPHYIALCDEDLLRYGTMAKMNPPLRSAADRDAVLAAIADGTVDMIATDHAPHTLGEKQLGFLDAPNGIIGLECAYGVCHKTLVDGGIVSDARLIELMGVAPAAMMGHPALNLTTAIDLQDDGHAGANGRRVLDLGRLASPDLADLVILDTAEQWTIRADDFKSKARNTPFDGWNVTGRAKATIVGGQFAALNN
ncbi:dihydroorotase [Bifidobacterium choloepi]|uniref:Amidohydrolase family protein n=1 Tax=Bifidobacterium choloepi TaxID=2614131 RepID=A0A6I5MZB3_9BIFI|nr:dihydroorotase [Bifidobacterium choloepi]NEG69165.1 amidohydrolase family protein [Bifidobacterium choloepi]